MAKPVTQFICSACGATHKKWSGRCEACGEWNCISEEAPLSAGPGKAALGAAKGRRIGLSDLRTQETPPPRRTSGMAEFDRVLGGGLVPASATLVGGDPGIGKSTLLLQAAASFARAGAKVVYVSGEEATAQVRMRAQRLGLADSAVMLAAETNLRDILTTLEAEAPDLAIIDSIQTMWLDTVEAAPGSVSQVRASAHELTTFAKRRGVSVMLVGHVTKEGMLAGPKVLEHLVDAVLTFEGDRFASHRLLRAVKNRFGATHELGVFEMRGQGLAQVLNPSELFLGSDEPSAGTATIVACEGTRPLVVELQSLVSTTSYASPRRTATGIGTNRLHQILAVLEKHLGLPLSRFDCYLAVAGGLDVEEPAADLGVAAAVVASYRDLTLPPGTVLVGELGLGGQLRPVGQLEQRLQEAARLGFNRAVVPKGSGLGRLAAGLDLQLHEAGSVAEALVAALGVNPADDRA